MLARGNSVICIYHSLAFLTSITSVHFHTCSLMWYWSGMCLIPSCRNCCATPATCWDEAEEHFLISPVPGSLLWPHTGLEGWVRFRTVWDFICARTGQTCTVQAGQLFLTQASSKWNPWQVFFMLLYREVTRNHLKSSDKTARLTTTGVYPGGSSCSFCPSRFVQPLLPQSTKRFPASNHRVRWNLGDVKWCCAMLLVSGPSEVNYTIINIFFPLILHNPDLILLLALASVTKFWSYSRQLQYCSSSSLSIC